MQKTQKVPQYCDVDQAIQRTGQKSMASARTQNKSNKMICLPRLSNNSTPPPVAKGTNAKLERNSR